MRQVYLSLQITPDFFVVTQVLGYILLNICSSKKLSSTKKKSIVNTQVRLIKRAHNEVMNIRFRHAGLDPASPA